MYSYQRLLETILSHGESTRDRTGVGTIAIFGAQMRWDLRKGFPAVTTKKLAWKAVVAELLWFMRGSTNVNDLRTLTHGKGSNKPTIWDANYQAQGKALGYKDGYLGPVYGKQWRDFGGVDQLANLIKNLRADMEQGTRGRRHLVTAWNPAELDKMTLPPCHYSFQVSLNSKNELSLMWNQRSVDAFLGLPFNIASYALLCHILASIIGASVGDLIFSGGDCHIYLDHLPQVQELLKRDPKELPMLVMPEILHLEHIYEVTAAQFKLDGYESHDTITAKMAV